MPKKKAGDKPVKAKSDYIGSDWLLLTEITADPEVQARVTLSEDVVADYGSAMLEQQDTEAGIQFPPCVVFDDGTTKWLSDGFHRYTAAQRTGGKVDRLDCEIRQGGKRDAMLYALGANATHGLRPSNEDKRKAVATMLGDPEWKQWADRQIARLCGVVHSYVGKIRGELQEATGDAVAEDPEQRRIYIDKHGVTTSMKVGGRRKKQKPSGDDDNDQAVEDDGSSSTSSVAGPDLGAVEVGAQRHANEKLTQDNELLRNEIESLRAGTTEPGGTLSEFQAAIKKWEALAEAQKTIIARLESEKASLLAAAPMTDGPHSLLDYLERAVATIDAALAVAIRDTWPAKAKDREIEKGRKALRDILSRLCGVRDVVDIYESRGPEERP
jgi:hypothetical protein